MVVKVTGTYVTNGAKRGLRPLSVVVFQLSRGRLPSLVFGLGSRYPETRITSPVSLSFRLSKSSLPSLVFGPAVHSPTTDHRHRTPTTDNRQPITSAARSR